MDELVEAVLEEATYDAKHIETGTIGLSDEYNSANVVYGVVENRNGAKLNIYAALEGNELQKIDQDIAEEAYNFWKAKNLGIFQRYREIDWEIREVERNPEIIDKVIDVSR